MQSLRLGVVEIVLIAVVIVLALLCITVPFSLAAQAVFVASLLGLAIVLRQMPGRFSMMLLIVLSLAALHFFVLFAESREAGAPRYRLLYLFAVMLGLAALFGAVTGTPRWPSSIARPMPTGPPPTMTTSVSNLLIGSVSPSNRDRAA